MKKYQKLITILLFISFITGCAMPLQKKSYPAWETKGLIDGNIIIDNQVIDGWQGININKLVETTQFNFQVNNYQEEAIDNKLKISLDITIENTSKSTLEIANKDFILMWNLENQDDASYTYPDNKDNYLILKTGETQTITLTYELNKSLKKPYALFYGENYNGIDGNSYYVYIK